MKKEKSMEQPVLNQPVLNRIADLRLPRYSEIPNVGLYLKQVVRWINDILTPYFDVAVTETMLSNYVKKHMVTSPTKKQYDREQIANLLFITLAKTVVSLDDIQLLLNMQREDYAPEAAYEYFCAEFEQVLLHVYGLTDSLPAVPAGSTREKLLLRSVIVTMAYKFHLDRSFCEVRIPDTAKASEDADGESADEGGEEADDAATESDETAKST